MTLSARSDFSPTQISQEVMPYSGVGDNSAEQRSNLVVFLDSYSLLRILLLTKWLRVAREILFAQPAAKQRAGRLKKRIILRWVRLLNPNAEIRELTMAEVVPDCYLLNKRGAEAAGLLGSKIECSVAYRMLLSIVRDESALLFYKAHLAREIAHSLLYAKMADRLIRDGGEVILSPDGMMGFGEAISLKWIEEVHAHTPAAIRVANRLANPIRSLRWKLASVLLSSALFLWHLRNGLVRLPKKRYAVAIPVVWGVFKDTEEKVVAGVRRFNDDMYLYDAHFAPGEILHIFGDWKFPTEVKKSYQEAMGEKGLPYVDKERFGVNRALFCLTLKTTRKVIQGLFRRGNPVQFAPALWEATTKGLYHFLLKQYEMENVDYQVELVRNDYNPGHIIATIVAHQHGRKRVGVSHAASPYDAPQMCFIHFDRYAASCDMYVRTFSPFWDSLQLEKIGRESIDSVVREMSRRDGIQKKLESLYGKRRWTITILLPGTAEASLVEQWDKMYQALLEFRDCDLDCHLFLRFRSIDLAREKSHMSRFLSLPERDPRVVVDHDNFNTHELMVASNLVIAASASFGINEALVAGVPVFTFGYTRKEHLYFPDYGRDFILRETEDVLRVLDGVKRGFKEFDCAWDRLWKDADYFHDGKNLTRLGGVVSRTLQDV
jgi:hypothetical protein